MKVINANFSWLKLLLVIIGFSIIAKSAVITSSAITIQPPAGFEGKTAKIQPSAALLTYRNNADNTLFTAFFFDSEEYQEDDDLNDSKSSLARDSQSCLTLTRQWLVGYNVDLHNSFASTWFSSLNRLPLHIIYHILRI